MSDEKPAQSQSSTSKSSRSKIGIPYSKVADFARRHHIRKLSLFGSVLRDDFRPDSDIDVLVEFEPDHIPDFFTLAGMEHELSDILSGRRADMRTPQELSKYFRDEVIDISELIYEA